jgi:hypothetical protein
VYVLDPLYNLLLVALQQLQHHLKKQQHHAIVGLVLQILSIGTTLKAWQSQKIHAPVYQHLHLPHVGLALQISSIGTILKVWNSQLIDALVFQIHLYHHPNIVGLVLLDINIGTKLKAGQNQKTSVLASFHLHLPHVGLVLLDISIGMM